MNSQIYDALDQGNAFTNPLPGYSAASQALITSGQANVTGLSSITDTQVQGALTAGGITSAKLTQTTSMYNAANTSIGTLNAYGNQTIDEAYSRMGTSVSYKSALKGIQREPNNCDLINNAFGVIQTTGRQWLNAMQSAMNTVTSKLGELYALAKQGVSAGLAKIQALASEVSGYITTAIAAVTDVAKQITDGIAAELAHIQSMIKSCLNFSFAGVLEEWAKDNCAAGVLSSIGSSTLKGALK